MHCCYSAAVAVPDVTVQGFVHMQVSFYFIVMVSTYKPVFIPFQPAIIMAL